MIYHPHFPKFLIKVTFGYLQISLPEVGLQREQLKASASLVRLSTVTETMLAVPTKKFNLQNKAKV